MPTIATLLAASLVTVIAVIGLADAVAHLAGWTVRSVKAAVTMRAVEPPSGLARPDRAVA